MTERPDEIRVTAETKGALTDFIEVGLNELLSITIIQTPGAALPRLDRIKSVGEPVKEDLRVLKTFVGAVKDRYEDKEFSVDADADPYIAGSGTLTRDMAEPGYEPTRPGDITKTTEKRLSQPEPMQSVLEMETLKAPRIRSSIQMAGHRLSPVFLVPVHDQKTMSVSFRVFHTNNVISTQIYVVY